MVKINKVAFLVTFFAFLYGCAGQNKHKDEFIRKVKVEQVAVSDSLLQRSFPGILREAMELDLAFRVAGPILEIDVKEGDYVRKGQLIARIDPRDYEVQLQVAQAQYDQVVAEAQRVMELYERKSVAGNEYDKAVSGKKMASAQLENAKNQLNDTRLNAPFSGFVHTINYSEGEMIDAGMPVITLIDVSHYEVEVEIPASFYIRKDDFVSFSGIQKTVSKEEFPLKIAGYSKKADNNQLYKLQLVIDHAGDCELAPGMDIQVKIVYKNQLNGIMLVPLDAVFNRDGKTFVWIYHKDDGIVKSRNVETGKLDGEGRIEILAGLEPEEMVVTAGVNFLFENQRVELAEPPSLTNPGGLL